MDDLNRLEAEEAALLKRLEELRKRKEEAKKPVEITIRFNFKGTDPTVGVKLNKYNEQIVEILRYIPGRYYSGGNQSNIFPIAKFPEIQYKLGNIENLKVTIEEPEKFEEWKNAPDFILTFDERKSNINVNKTIRKTSLPYAYSIPTFTNHTINNFYSFNISDIEGWLEWQVILEKQYKWKFEITQEVKDIFEKEIERQKLVEEFANMEDAPDITFMFRYIDPVTNEEKEYQLKKDQRVAVKFDQVSGSRELISYDMGKGKTAIAIALAEINQERVLFVCKASLKTNIKREIKKFTGKEAVVFAGIEPSPLAGKKMLLDKQQYNIINYEIIGREIKDGDQGTGLMKWVELIKAAKFDRIIFDEAHYMKNTASQRSKGGMAIGSSAEKVSLLTGTPVVNRPGELFPILNIIDPKNYNDQATFIRTYTIDGQTPKNLDKLHKQLKKYMIRRTRDTALDPNRITQYTELTEVARKHYETVLAGIYVALRNPNDQSNVTNVLTELLRLKQIMADDKVDYTVDLIETALDEESDDPHNKVIVFSQFKNTQAEIAKRLGRRAAIINGDVTDKARYDIVDRFQEEGIFEGDKSLQVIVTSITEGITLTKAGTVIFNDFWWTPKDHIQGEGRAFGRENDPHGGNSYYILCENTLDETIWKILERKMNIIKQVIDNVYHKYEEDESMFNELIRIIRGGT